MDAIDRIERMLIRCIEEDRRERRLKREQRKNGTLPEAEKRIKEWLERKQKFRTGRISLQISRKDWTQCWVQYDEQL